MIDAQTASAFETQNFGSLETRPVDPMMFWEINVLGPTMKVPEGKMHITCICLSYFQSTPIETTPSPEVHGFRKLLPPTLESGSLIFSPAWAIISDLKRITDAHQEPKSWGLLKTYLAGGLDFCQGWASCFNDHPFRNASWESLRIF